jgi:hypothetical protein
MAYVTSTSLNPIITTNNGNENIEFIKSLCTFKEEDVNYATQYFNPVVGQYDDSKTTVYFESGQILIIDQAYQITSAQLIALN